MGRKGDIVSKVIGVRTPIKTYTKLLNDASDKGISLSEYCVSLLSNQSDLSIDYKDKWENMVVLNNQLENKLKKYEDLIEKMKLEHKKDIDAWVSIVKDDNKEIKDLQEKLKGKY